jgi:hypothetical protein
MRRHNRSLTARTPLLVGTIALTAGALLPRPAFAVSHRYEADLQPLGVRDFTIRGTPPSGDVAGIYVGNQASFEARLAMEYDLSVLPADAQLVGNATLPFWICCFSHSGSSVWPVGYYGSIGNGTVDGAEMVTTTNFLGSVPIGLGPRIAELNTTYIQQLLDDGRRYLGIGGRHLATTGSVGWAEIEQSFTTAFDGGELSVQYEIDDPDAAFFHTVPVYDGGLNRISSESDWYLVLDDSGLAVGDQIFGTDFSQRAVAEFDLDTVAPDTPIASATLRAISLGTQPFIDPHRGGVYFNGFAGNGTPSADAFQAEGNVVGHSGKLGYSGQAVEVSLNPFYVEELLRAGQNLGLLLSPDRGPDYVHVLAALEHYNRDRFELDLQFAASPTATRSMAFRPVEDATLRASPSQNEVLPETDFLSAMDEGGGSSLRAELEFDLAPYPRTQARLIAATLEVDIATYNTPPDPLRLSVYAHPGDGATNFFDPLLAENLIAQSSEITSPDNITITLDENKLRGLIRQHQYLSLILAVEQQAGQVQLMSARALTGTHPTLTLHFAPIPEPTTLALFLFAVTIPACSISSISRRRHTQ